VLIWAHSYCRSTLAFYDVLARELCQPLRICLAEASLGEREKIGYTKEEFAHLNFIDVSSLRVAAQVLEESNEQLHIFGSYHSRSQQRRIVESAIRRGYRVGIASEAPCNMFAPGLLRRAKGMYMANGLAPLVRRVTAGAAFIINWSGDDGASLQAIGWDAHKIIPCGYFSPPLEISRFVQRDASNLKSFHILCTGSMTWHRGPDVLMEALVLLKGWNVPFRATFTGTGPLEPHLRRVAVEQDLSCDFPGLVPMAELIELYETCSLFVSPGRAEPWGIRVNDAVNCGAPLVVSRGMGASKIVFDYQVGSTCGAGDPVDLAWQIRRLMDPDRYRLACDNVSRYRAQIAPEQAAARLARVIRSDFADWLHQSP
jgi:glycosyltransferase involved in cell wall biosynthesis